MLYPLPITGLVFCSNANASDPTDSLRNICTIVKNNDKTELRKKLSLMKREFRLKLDDYYAGITCAGNSLIRHAMKSDSEDVGIYMVKKMSRNTLNQSEVDGETLVNWASINGFIKHPIGEALISRIE